MKELEVPPETLEKLNKHDQEYVDMINKYPKLLTPKFSKDPPVHGVYHRVDTADHPPCRAKRRPLIANKDKAEAGRRVWMKMAEDGEDEQFEEIEKRAGHVEDEDFEEDTQEEVFDQPLKDLDMVDY